MGQTTVFLRSTEKTVVYSILFNVQRWARHMNGGVSRIFIIALLAGLSGAAAADKIQVLPQLMLTAIDARSEKPLSGITVHHMVTRETHWTVFPLTIEAHIDSDIVAAITAQTDSNGVVTFSDIKVKLESYLLSPKAQRIDHEVLFINLDPLGKPPNYMRSYDKYEYLWISVPFFKDLERPNEKYLGYFLGLADISGAHEREEHGVATVRWEPERFSGVERRSFIVRLKPDSQLHAQPSVSVDGPHPMGSARH